MALESGAIDMNKIRQREQQKERQSRGEEPDSEGFLMELGDVLADNIGLLLFLFFFIAIGLALILADTQGVDWERVTSDLSQFFGSQ